MRCYNFLLHQNIALDISFDYNKIENSRALCSDIRHKLTKPIGFHHRRIRGFAEPIEAARIATSKHYILIDIMNGA